MDDTTKCGTAERTLHQTIWKCDACGEAVCSLCMEHDGRCKCEPVPGVCSACKAPGAYLFVDLGEDGKIWFCTVQCAGHLGLAVQRDLEAWLDADRGRDNGGYGDPRPSLRAILFSRYVACGPEECHWDWLRERTDASLRSHRTGMWDSNQIDYLVAAEWELERRKQNVSDDQVRAWAAQKG